MPAGRSSIKPQDLAGSRVYILQILMYVLVAVTVVMRVPRAAASAGRTNQVIGTVSAASAWCPKTPGYSAARSGTTSATVGKAPTDEEIVAAAKAAYTDDFIRAFLDGYATVLDGNASTISAGPEAAAPRQPGHPDPGRGHEQRRYPHRADDPGRDARLRAGRTSFGTAHRLSTIWDANTIVVIDAGRVVEQGSYEELLRRHGFYRDLCNSQFPTPSSIA
jgi:hypothetical protein